MQNIHTLQKNLSVCITKKFIVEKNNSSHKKCYNIINKYFFNEQTGQ